MSHRRAKIVLAAVLLLLLGPMLARGRVVFPHDNGVEVGLGTPTPGRFNRKFNDESSVYVPEIHQHLNGDHRGWISTWNPHSQLGRPTFQLAGEGKAFFLTHLLSFFTHDAFWLYTWQAVAALVAASFFGYLALQALGLQPLACLVGALGLGCGFFPLYWTTFVLFVWSIAWTLAILWLIELWLQRPSAAKVLGLAVAVQSLLLTGYPQTIVWHAWLTLVFLAWRLRVHRAAALGGRRPGLRDVLALGLAAGLGLLAAAPAYLDLAETAARSARLEAGVDFFLQILPRPEDLGALATFWLQRFDATWLGDPILESYPERFNGLCATPLFFGLALLSLLEWRRLWGAWLFVGVCLTMTLWPAAYAFGIRWLGLSLSRTVPLSAAFLPVCFLAARALDARLTSGVAGRGPALALLGAASLGVLACAGATPLPLHWGFVAAGATLWALLAAFVASGRGALVLVAAVAGTLHYGWRLQLSRPRDGIHTESALTRLIRREARGGERYAWIEGGYGVTLPSNQETLLGLYSIHSYDSLSSRAYQELARRLSPHGTQTYGRFFTHIALPRAAPLSEGRGKFAELLDHVALSRAGVRVLLTNEKELPSSLAEPVSGPGVKGGVWRARLEPLLQAQVAASSVPPTADGERFLPSDFPRGPLVVERLEEHDDSLRLRVTPCDEQTLLFLSRQYHPRWVATAGTGAPLETLALDGFYQGVLLPPGAEELTLAFRPWVRFAWVPQLVGLLAALALGLRALLARGSASPPAQEQVVGR